MCQTVALTPYSYTREGFGLILSDTYLPNEFISNWTLKFPNMHTIFTVIINLIEFF